MIGPLPAGFLRLNTEREIQESADRQAAIALYQQQNAAYMVISSKLFDKKKSIEFFNFGINTMKLSIFSNRLRILWDALA